MGAAPACADTPVRSDAPSSATAPIERLYEEHFEFVWRFLCRLAVPRHAVDDAVQDVFMVAYRRLAEFQGRSSVRTWLAGIATRVAAEHRRRARSRDEHDPLFESVVDARPGPHELAVASEHLKLVDELLSRLDDERREVFILADIEGMSAPEISEALGIKLNTVYSRLRVARQKFDAAAARRNRGER
ncbi:MAG: sigma-70 family RNA polymerase sigma factor [Myxococcales bacterium]